MKRLCWTIYEHFISEPLIGLIKATLDDLIYWISMDFSLWSIDSNGDRTRNAERLTHNNCTNGKDTLHFWCNWTLHLSVDCFWLLEHEDEHEQTWCEEHVKGEDNVQYLLLSLWQKDWPGRKFSDKQCAINSWPSNVKCCLHAKDIKRYIYMYLLRQALFYCSRTILKPCKLRLAGIAALTVES